MKIKKHGDMYINVGEKGHFYLSTSPSKNQDFDYGYINTELSVNANMPAEYTGLMIMPTCDFFEFDKFIERDNGFSVQYNLDKKPVQVNENIKLFSNINAVEQFTEVVNNGDKPIRISKLACANVLGIGIDGEKYFQDNRFIVHYCSNLWQGEGQWVHKPLLECDVYPCSNHIWERETFRIQNTGSWSTNRYYPILLIEDTEKKECWYFERKDACDWYIEINIYEGYNNSFLTVALGDADESMGFTYDLQPNEKYTSCTAVYGLVKGGFEDAIKELLKYKRQDNVCTKEPKIVFNDFMNCNWGMPNYDKLIPLIDKASELGVDCFCIDDGWQKSGGLWKPDQSKFTPSTFENVIQYIIKKGMRAGVWMEFEFVSADVAKDYDDDFLLKRDGIVLNEHRPKLNIRNPQAKKYLKDCIDYLYKTGVRYIKNDHNNDELVGTNYVGENIAEGLKRKAKSLYDFIDELNKEYPDLVIENCGAGGGRMDWGTLRHFAIQSTSDQEDYRRYPSIISGVLALVPPEKAGNWSYTYPLLYENIESGKIPSEKLNLLVDGEETIFNMINGLMGTLYLSGKLHYADEYNTMLIKEGISLSKQYRLFIENSYPIYPQGTLKMLEHKVYSLGLKNENKREIIFAVWNLTDSKQKYIIDLCKYNIKECTLLYPTKDNFKFSCKRGVLKCSFDKPYMARLFKLKY